MFKMWWTWIGEKGGVNYKCGMNFNLLTGPQDSQDPVAYVGRLYQHRI